MYPKADNWGLAQWRVSLNKLDIYDDLDSKARYPGSDGDWILWMMLPSADQSWTRILDGFNNAHGTITFTPPWQTGAVDPVLHRPPLSLDPQRHLGPDILSFNSFVNFWMGGYEADEGEDGDPGRITGFVPGLISWYSDKAVFSADLTAERIATLNNGTLTPAAAELGRHYLISCTNRVNLHNPFHDGISPLGSAGLLVEGVSGEPPWKPVDPMQMYGPGAALLGDVNRDGFPDMALAVNGSNAQAHIFLGGRNGFPPAPLSVASVTPPGTAGNSSVLPHARNVLGAGDVNGDGVPDLLLSLPYFMNGQTNEGAAYLLSGSQLGASGTISNAIWSVEGNLPNAEFGFAIAAGDINHDGYSDVVVGAPYHPNSGVPPGMPQVLGQVFVYFGSPAGLSTTADQVLTPNVLIGGTHWFGYSLSIVGDVNGDGYADVIIGAPAFTHSQANEGAIYLYYGSSTGLVVNTASVFEGNVAGAQSGYAVAGAGDVDGDGYADVLVGAPFYGSGEFTVEEGYASVLRGSIEGISVTFWGIYGGYAGAHFGSDLAGVGDINGDGLADFAVAAPDELNSDGLRGRVSLFLGAPGPGTGIASETWRAWGVSGIARPPACRTPATSMETASTTRWRSIR